MTKREWKQRRWERKREKKARREMARLAPTLAKLIDMDRLLNG